MSAMRAPARDLAARPPPHPAQPRDRDARGRDRAAARRSCACPTTASWWAIRPPASSTAASSRRCWTARRERRWAARWLRRGRQEPRRLAADRDARPAHRLHEAGDARQGPDGARRVLQADAQRGVRARRRLPRRSLRSDRDLDRHLHAVGARPRAEARRRPSRSIACSHFGDIESLHALLESTPYTRCSASACAEEPIAPASRRCPCLRRYQRADLRPALQRGHHRQHPPAGDPRRRDRRVPRDHRARDADLGERQRVPAQDHRHLHRVPALGQAARHLRAGDHHQARAPRRQRAGGGLAGGSVAADRRGARPLPDQAARGPGARAPEASA